MPSKMVNRPTDPKQKEQSINEKLQLYGIYYGMFGHPSSVRSSLYRQAGSRPGTRHHG